MWSQRDGRLSTITKVKVLSLEMHGIALDEGFIIPEVSIAACVNGERASNVPGSEAMVDNRIVCTGTWKLPDCWRIKVDDVTTFDRFYGRMVGLRRAGGPAWPSHGGREIDGMPFKEKVGLSR